MPSALPELDLEPEEEEASMLNSNPFLSKDAEPKLAGAQHSQQQADEGVSNPKAAAGVSSTLSTTDSTTLTLSTPSSRGSLPSVSSEWSSTK